MEDGPHSETALRAWLERLLGGTVTGWRRLVAGNSRTTWAADVAVADRSLPLVVRVDTGDGPFSDTPLSLAREAAVYDALAGRGVALPRSYGFDQGLCALALERAAGAPVWDERVLDALLGQLVALHAIDLRELGGNWTARTALADLELWARIGHGRISPPSPLVQYAVDFLRERYPGEPHRLVVIHGDAGPGNLLWDGERITALLDWELCHTGDPHDDLAFLTVRAALHGIELPDFAARAGRHYFAASGFAPDNDRLRFWQAVSLLRNLITCLASVSNPLRGRDRLVHHMLLPALGRMLVDALARIEGVTLEVPEPVGVAPALPGTPVLTEIVAGFDAIIKAIPDDEPRQRARRMRHLLAQLAETLPLAPGLLAQQERDRAHPGESAAAALARLSRSADRGLALFPRAAALARTPLADLQASCGITSAANRSRSAPTNPATNT
jgi:aminoglycoside phosphotransferase (APT) family kinase protein